MTDPVQDLLMRIPDEELRAELGRALTRRDLGVRRLYIPEIKDELTLIQPWTFELYPEYRNLALWKALEKGAEESYSSPIRKVHEDGRYTDIPRTITHYSMGSSPVEVTLPVGTRLVVDRVYIRQGAKEYSSITFRSRIPGIKTKPRFWAKLRDVNNIVIGTA